LPTGVGNATIAAIAGLPAEYIKQQFAEFRSGRRGCALQKDGACSQAMQMISKAVMPAELTAAAGYFSHLTYRSRIRVIETERVPETRR
jgi:cytochrome c553